jgi:2-polyprenyl-3-methyl-5-hydroxy-6-metoxy-1,4-benzoquinol methylase
MTNDTDSVITGNHFDKYSSKNPIVKWMMSGFMSSFDQFLSRCPANSAHEVGCGEGHLLSHMMERGVEVRGSDIGADVIAEATERFSRHGSNVPLKQSTLESLTTKDDSAELIVCCEVLEHVEDPARALLQLGMLAQPYLLTSVPREPLWRFLNIVRGRYLGDLGNTPGHLNHWSRRGFLKFLESRFDIIEIASPVPWTMVLCKVKEQSESVDDSSQSSRID